MVRNVVTAAARDGAALGSAEPGATGSGLGTVLAYVGMVLLAALLPFVLSFVGDAVASMIRRGRAALPVLVVAVVASVAVAGLGVVLLGLGLGLTGDAELADPLSGLARGLLLVCAPLAVLALVLRLALARARARRSPADGTGEADGPDSDQG